MADDWEDWEDEGLEPTLPGVAGGVKAPAATAKKVSEGGVEGRFFLMRSLHGRKCSSQAHAP